MKFRKINRHYKEKPSVGLLCEVLRVSRSGYYKWKKQVVHKTRLMQSYHREIKRVWQESDGTYGSPRVYQALRAKGILIGERKVAKVMKELGISGAGKKAFRCRTTDSKHQYQAAERLLNTTQTPVANLAANQIWVGDITYIRLSRGFCYLAVFMDLATRKIVGYSIRDSLNATIVLEALNTAIAKERPAAGLIIHTDRGSQYCCESYRELLKQKGFKISMSRSGNCYDNAFMESFFRSLKVELINRFKFETVAKVRTALFRYFEVWYNRQRMHSSLDYMCPIDYEKRIAKNT